MCPQIKYHQNTSLAEIISKYKGPATFYLKAEDNGVQRKCNFVGSLVEPTSNIDNNITESLVRLMLIGGIVTENSSFYSDFKSEYTKFYCKPNIEVIKIIITFE